ncbi:MAG: helix-turn-helix transcriptional regulator [Chloroflexi bacterium]|nr:MAG: helix-turn-helix transcriptional regulator [Chloroflexota bacterium]
MATITSQPRVGPLLREWRRRRRRTQLDLALEAGISARHLSFVETGRSTPSPETVLRLAEQLGVPFRERNLLLLAAGHAPAFPQRSLDDPDMAPVREALELILTGHMPYPAVVFDRAWNLVTANSAVLPLIEGVDPALLVPPINVLRVGLHIAPRILNFGEAYAFIRERLERQAAITGDANLAALVEEFAGYPAPAPRHGRASRSGADDILGPVRMRAPNGGEWAFFGMFATFDTPFEVTTSELAIELFFPADAGTAAAFRDHRAKGRYAPP